MRRLAETLPTLREAPPAGARLLLPPPGAGEGFDPAAVVRALAARRARAFPAASDGAPEDAAGAAAADAMDPDAMDADVMNLDGTDPAAPPARGAGAAHRWRDDSSALAPVPPHAGRTAATEGSGTAEGRWAADGKAAAGGTGAAATARARLAALARSRARPSGEEDAAPPFECAPPRAPHAAVRGRQVGVPPIPPIDPPKEPAEDRVVVAVAEALKMAEEEKARAVEAARAEERAAAEARLAEARAAWVANEAEVVAARFGEAFETLHARLSDAFGRALAPLADGAVRERALRRFAGIVDDLAGDGASEAALVVRGPHDLVQALRRIMGERRAVAFEPADTTELVVTLGDTRVETVVGAWADDLAKALGTST